MTLIETASHGGLHLAGRALEAIPRAVGATFINGPSWTEEDCELAIALAILHAAGLVPADKLLGLTPARLADVARRTASSSTPTPARCSTCPPAEPPANAGAQPPTPNNPNRTTRARPSTGRTRRTLRMTITIKPLVRGEQRRDVRIGRTGKGYLAETRGAHVLEDLNRWRAYNGMRFPIVDAARAWLKEQFADVDEACPPPAGPRA